MSIVLVPAESQTAVVFGQGQMWDLCYQHNIGPGRVSDCSHVRPGPGMGSVLSAQYRSQLRLRLQPCSAGARCEIYSMGAVSVPAEHPTAAMVGRDQYSIESVLDREEEA
jgi:hypothetical protein